MKPSLTEPLILVLVGSTAYLSCSGMVLVAPQPPTQDGQDTAITVLCYSQLGTDPMLLFTRFFAFFLKSDSSTDRHHITDRII
jgi:hypothetical protein